MHHSGFNINRERVTSGYKLYFLVIMLKRENITVQAGVKSKTNSVKTALRLDEIAVAPLSKVNVLATHMNLSQYYQLPRYMDKGAK